MRSLHLYLYKILIKHNNKHIFRHTILKLLNTSIPLLIHLFDSIYSFIVNHPYASSCCLQVNTLLCILVSIVVISIMLRHGPTSQPPPPLPHALHSYVIIKLFHLIQMPYVLYH